MDTCLDFSVEVATWTCVAQGGVHIGLCFRNIAEDDRFPDLNQSFIVHLWLNATVWYLCVSQRCTCFSSVVFGIDVLTETWRWWKVSCFYCSSSFHLLSWLRCLYICPCLEHVKCYPPSFCFLKFCLFNFISIYLSFACSSNFVILCDFFPFAPDFFPFSYLKSPPAASWRPHCVAEGQPSPPWTVSPCL